MALVQCGLLRRPAEDPGRQLAGRQDDARFPAGTLTRSHRAQARTTYAWPESGSSETAVRLRYGIESYFLPEAQGRKLEALAREKKLATLLAVDGEGNAAIKGLVVDGALQYEEPLF